MNFADEDIMAYDTATGIWSRYFDSSDVNVNASDVDAFAFLDDGSLLLSFSSEVDVPGLGIVDRYDIVRFAATQMGQVITGTFEWYFDGSDVWLETNGENIDALSVFSDGRIVISTVGNFNVTGLSTKDEDLVAFTPTQLGQDTVGTWSLYFDGSDEQLDTDGSEDVSGVSIDEVTGDLYITTQGNFDVGTFSSDSADIFSCAPQSLCSQTNCITPTPTSTSTDTHTPTNTSTATDTPVGTPIPPTNRMVRCCLVLVRIRSMFLGWGLSMMPMLSSSTQHSLAPSRLEPLSTTLMAL